MSRDIGHLHPLARVVCLEHMRQAAALGLKVNLIETYRNLEDQEKAWLKGRDSNGVIIYPEEVVTKVRPGNSWHNLTFRNGNPASLAYHLAIAIPGGRLLGFGASKLDIAGLKLYECLGTLGKDLDLRWGGDWDEDDKLREKGENDLIHYEYHPAGARLEEVIALMESEGDIHSLVEA